MSRAAVLVLTGFIAVLAMAALAWSAAAALQQEPEVRRGQEVPICHATGNDKYTSISPDVDSIVGDQGHGGHEKDIIPPFAYPPSGQDPGGSYPGLNWPAGEATWRNGCVKPEPPPQQYATLRVRKVVVPAGSTSPNTFSFNLDGQTHVFEPDGVNDVPLLPGTYSVTEVRAAGYEPSLNGCTGIVVSVGEQPVPECVITNTATATATATLRVRKVVVPAGSTSPNTFSFNLDGQTHVFEPDGVNDVPLLPGTYSVTEVRAAGYEPSLNGCTGIVVSVGQQPVPECVITNTATATATATLRVRKVVVPAGSTSPNTFSFNLDGQTHVFEPDGVNDVPLLPGTYSVTEVRAAGYEPSLNGCTGIVVSVGQQPVPECVITNTAEKPAPPPVYPIGVLVKCVDNLADGSFAATFGYSSANTTEVAVPIGSLNEVTPGGPDRGQPSTFAPGSVEAAFTVSGPSDTPIVWAVTTPSPDTGDPDTARATARATHETKCSDTPEPPTPANVSIFVTCVVNGASTFSATFGYENLDATQVSIPAGPQNRFTPEPEFRNQPIEFLPGTVGNAVTVPAIPNGTTLTWTIDTGNPTRSGAPVAEASADFATKCGEEPIPPEPPIPPITPIPPEPPPGPTPDPIGIFVQCVTNRGSSYDAVFGYQNDNEDVVEIAVGARNRFQPTPPNRGQTTEFLPGNHQEAFTVTGIQTANALAWEVTHAGDTRVATVASNFPEKCSAAPAPTQPIGIFACIVDRGSTYDAVFGYESDNPADVSIPIGLANAVLPRPVNRGQPTVFSPGKHEDAFTIRGIPDDRLVSWIVSYRGTRFVLVSSSWETKCSGTDPKLPLQIAPLCVRREGQSYTAVFSYANLTRRDMVIPVGRANGVSPAPTNRGQPVVFRPGIVLFAFAVSDVPVSQNVTWTVSNGGKVETARASADLARDCRLLSAEGEVDFAIEKSVRPSAVMVGERLEYTIAVRSLGTTATGTVTMLDRQLDRRVEVLSATTASGHCLIRGGGASPQRVLCVLRDVGPGDSATIVVAARALEPGTARNRATVVSVPIDVAANNSATAAVTIRGRQQVSPGGEQPKPPFTG